MALVPTIPDVLYIGATAVDRVYQGPEQIWPEAVEDPLVAGILALAPMHYWPCDDTSGSLRDLGFGATPLTPIGSPTYGVASDFGGRSAVIVENGINEFEMTWDSPGPDLTVIMFNNPSGTYTGGAVVQAHKTAGDYDFTIRGNNPGGAVDGGASWMRRTSATGRLEFDVADYEPTMWMQRGTATQHLLAYRNNIDSSNKGESRGQIAQTGQQFLLGASYGPARVCHVAVFDKIVPVADFDALWDLI